MDLDDVDEVAERFVAAARDGDLEVVRRLHEEEGVLLQASARFGGETAVEEAARYGQVQVLEYLHGKNANLCRTMNRFGHAVAHIAAANNRVGCIRFLRKTAKVDLLMRDASGETCAHSAASWGGLKVLRYLGVHCAAVLTTRCRDKGQTPLIVAAQHNWLPCVRYLYERLGPAHAGLTDMNGNTAAEIASGACIKYLKTTGPREWKKRREHRAKAEQVLSGYLGDHVPEVVALMGDYLCPRE